MMKAYSNKGAKMQKFVINEKLPTINDIIRRTNRNRFVGARLKADTDAIIKNYIYESLDAGRIKKVKKPIVILIDYYEGKRRDVDNIQSSQKFILDSLVEAGVLVDDSQKYVKQIYHRIFNSKKEYSVVYLLNENEIELILKDTPDR